MAASLEISPHHLHHATPSATPVKEDADSDRDAASSTTTSNDDVNQGEHFLIGTCKLC